MKRLAIFIVIFFISIAFTDRAHALEVTARINKSSLSFQEVLTLIVSITEGEGSVDTSSVKDFKVLSQGTSTSVQIVNGQVSRESIHKFMLLPLKEGQLSVPPLRVEIDGKNYMTDEITVTVSGDPVDRSGETVGKKHSDVYVEADISDASPFEGQQIIYTFRLFTAVNISNASFQPPPFEGFSSREIEPHKSYEKVIGQKKYHVEEVDYILIPVKTGSLVIQPSLLNCRMFTGRNRSPFPFGSTFENPFFITHTKEKLLRTKPLPMEVKPLPTFKGRDKFSGLVGQFSITSKVGQNVYNVGDSTTLKIVITGTGNIMDAKIPEISLPEAFKAYEDNPEEKITADHRGYSGSKIFRMALVAVKPGDFDIKPARLTFFNTKKEQYETVESAPLHLSIRPSLQKNTLEIASAGEVKNINSLKKKVKFTGRDILPLKEDLDALKNKKKISPGWFLVFLLSPALLYGLLFASFRITRKKEDPRSVMAGRATAALKKAQKNSSDPEMFLSHLYRALISAVLAKGAMKGASLTYIETENILRKNAVSSETAKEAAQLLMRIDSLRYGGEKKNSEFLKDLLIKTEKMVGSLL